MMAFSSSRQLVLTTISLALQAIAWAGLLGYAFWSVAFLLPNWVWVWLDPKNPWENFRLHNYIRYHMTSEAGEQTLYGWDVLVILGWWFPILLASVCAFTAHTLAAVSAEQPARGSQLDNSKGSIIFKKLVLAKLHKIMQWQIPLRSWWVYWCGGLSLAEASTVVAWIVIHAVGFWDFLVFYGKKFDAWDDTGLVYHVPKSVLWLEWISYAFAWLSFFDLAMLFLPISHNNFLNLLTGLPYPALIRYHRWIGHSTLWMVALHGIFFYLFWIADPTVNFAKEFFDFGQHSYINIFAGSISFFFGLALWVTSLNWVRRQYFEVFYKTHIVGFVGFVFFAFLHYNWVWAVVVPGLALYAGDYILRLVQSQSVTTISSAHVTSNKQVAVLELQVANDFCKCPVQDLFLLLPSISRWQWHPFTIMSRNTTSSPPSVTVALKSYGKWTKEFIKQLDSGIPVPARVTGAMDGIKLTDLQQYNQLVLIAGGIAATPLIQLLEEISRGKEQQHPALESLQKVELIWATRDVQEFTILPTALMATASSTTWLSIKLFSTGKNFDSKHDIAPGGMITKTTNLPNNFPEAGKSLSAPDPDHSRMHATPNNLDLGSAFPLPIIQNETTTMFPTASAFFWNITKPVPSKTFGPWYTLAIIIAAFLGAFLGLVAAQPMHLEWAHAYETYSTYYKYGLVVAISIIVQTIGLPMALVVLPVYTFRHFQERRSPSAASPQRSGSSSPGTSANNNNYPALQGQSRLTVLESGLSIDINRGRPDLSQLVVEAALASGVSNSVGVFCAGPAALMNTTALLVWNLNDARKHSPMAHIDFHKFAFEL